MPLSDTATVCTYCGTRPYGGPAPARITPVSSAPITVTHAPAAASSPAPTTLSGALTSSAGIPSHISDILAPEPASSAAAPASSTPASAVNASSPLSNALTPSSELPSHISDILAPEPESRNSAPAQQSARQSTQQSTQQSAPAQQTAPVVPTQTSAPVTPAPAETPVINRPEFSRPDKTPPGKTTAMGVVGIIVFSLVLVVSLVMSYVSLVASSFCSSYSVGNFGFSIGDYRTSYEELTYITNQFENDGTRDLVRAMYESDGPYQMRVGSRIYDVYFDYSTVSMLYELVMPEDGYGLSEKIDDTVDSALDTVATISTALFVFALLAAAASAVAVIKCFGKKRAGLIFAAVVILVVGLFLTIGTFMGINGVSPLFEKIITSAVLGAGVIDIAGISLLVGGLFSEKKEV